MSKFVAATGKLPDNVNLFRYLQDGEYFATLRVQLPEDDPYAFWTEEDVFKAFFEKGIDNVVSPDPIVAKAIEEIDPENNEPIFLNNAGTREVSPGGNITYYFLTPDIVRDIVALQGEEAFDWADGSAGWDTYSLVQDNPECAKFYQSLKPLVLDLSDSDMGEPRGAKKGIKTRAAKLRDGEEINDEDLYVDDESYDQEYSYIVPANEYPFIIHVHVGEYAPVSPVS